MAPHSVCAWCAAHHDTAACHLAPTAEHAQLHCANCLGTEADGYGAASHSCPTFLKKLQTMFAYSAANKYKFFPTDDPSTWAPANNSIPWGVDPATWQTMIKAPPPPPRRPPCHPLHMFPIASAPGNTTHPLLPCPMSSDPVPTTNLINSQQTTMHPPAPPTTCSLTFQGRTQIMGSSDIQKKSGKSGRLDNYFLPSRPPSRASEPGDNIASMSSTTQPPPRIDGWETM
ncbi:hypothetical protein BDQ17DRAFT_1438195 [Cyathus striatus]|nr:hypothetical protein BDQ17DRAFT_1438195 [Cyathus striatus]